LIQQVQALGIVIPEEILEDFEIVRIEEGEEERRSTWWRRRAGSQKSKRNC